MKSPALVYRSEAPLTELQELCVNPGVSWESPYDMLTDGERGEFHAWIDSFGDFRYDNENVRDHA